MDNTITYAAMDTHKKQHVGAVMHQTKHKSIRLTKVVPYQGGARVFKPCKGPLFRAEKALEG